MAPNTSTTFWKDFTSATYIPLKTIADASSLIPVPYITQAASVVAGLLEKIQTTNDNKEDLLELAQDATQLVLAITAEFQRQDNKRDWLGKELTDAGDEFIKTLQKISKFVDRRAKKRWLRRFLTSIADKNHVTSYRNRLATANRKFQLTLQLGIRRELAEVVETTRNIKERLDESTGQILTAVDEKEAIAHLKKWVVYAAMHHSAERFPPPKCDEGSRKQVIAHILKWCQQTSTEDDKDIFWLNALFGSGKSAIMQTLAEELARLEPALGRPILGGAFFFGRGKAKRNQALYLLPTIVEQMRHKFPEFRKNLYQQILQDPFTLTKLETQPVDLLVSPFSQSNAKTSDSYPLIILVDGLDECEGVVEGSECDAKTAQGFVLDAIRLLSRSNLNLRFIVASRPDRHLQDRFDGDLDPFTEKLSLHDQRWLSEGRRSIHNKFRNGFEEIRRRSPDLEANWPGLGVLRYLTWAAGDQYLYATTVLAFVGSTDFPPKDQLKIILDSRNEGRFEAFTPIDKLLRQILGSCPSRQRASMMLILAVLRLHPNVIGVRALSALTNISPEEVKIILRRLSGIVSVTVEHRESKEVVLVCEKYQFLPDLFYYRFGHVSRAHVHNSVWDPLWSILMYNLRTAQHRPIEPFLVDVIRLQQTFESIVNKSLPFQFPLSLSALRGIKVISRYLPDKSLDVSGTSVCDDLWKTSVVQRFSNLRANPAATAVFEADVSSRILGLTFNWLVVAVHFSDSCDAIAPTSDIFDFGLRGTVIPKEVENLLWNEVKQRTPVGRDFQRNVFRAYRAIFGWIYPEEYPPPSWLLQNYHAGDQKFGDKFGWDDLMRHTESVYLTKELRELLESLNHVLDIALKSTSRPPQMVLRLFITFRLFTIHAWVQCLQEVSIPALEQEAALSEGRESDPLLIDVVQLINQLGQQVKEGDVKWKEDLIDHYRQHVWGAPVGLDVGDARISEDEYENGEEQNP